MNVRLQPQPSGRFWEPSDLIIFIHFPSHVFRLNPVIESQLAIGDRPLCVQIRFFEAFWKHFDTSHNSAQIGSPRGVFLGCAIFKLDPC